MKNAVHKNVDRADSVSVLNQDSSKNQSQLFFPLRGKFEDMDKVAPTQDCFRSTNSCILSVVGEIEEFLALDIFLQNHTVLTFVVSNWEVWWDRLLHVRSSATRQ